MEPLTIRMGDYIPRNSFEIRCYHDLQQYAYSTGFKWIRMKKKKYGWDIYSLINPGLTKIVDEPIGIRFQRWLNFINKRSE